MRNLIIDKQKRNLTIGGFTWCSAWTIEAVEDMVGYHSLDIKSELISAIIDELDRQLKLTKFEKRFMTKQLDNVFK